MSDEAKHQPNILKCRDDQKPIYLALSSEAKGNTPEFKLSEGSTCSWAKADEAVRPEKLRKHIEPWLTALCQSEHLSLLVGSGMTHAVHGIARGEKEKLPGMGWAEYSVLKEEINQAAKVSAAKANRNKENFEDQMRVALELLRGLGLYCPESEAGNDQKEGWRPIIEKLDEEIQHALREFAASILAGENSIATADESGRENAFDYLVSFLMSFASRTGTRDRLQLFTTNYDRVLEAGAEIAGIHLLDRFVGNLCPILRSSRLNLDMHYNPPGIRGEPRYLEGVVRFTKLHGSIDWVCAGRDIRRIGLPFGADDLAPYFQAPGLQDVSALDVMIYPNSAKDRETALFPYVEAFRDLAAGICRPNSTLVTYGYSFGDEHINRVIEDMLTVPSTHLVIISKDDPLGRIMATYKSLGRPSQISLLVGAHLGDLTALVDHYLPKPAIDRTTYRMSELLKARWGTREVEDDKSKSDPPPQLDIVL